MSINFFVSSYLREFCTVGTLLPRYIKWIKNRKIGYQHDLFATMRTEQFRSCLSNTKPTEHVLKGAFLTAAKVHNTTKPNSVPMLSEKKKASRIFFHAHRAHHSGKIKEESIC